MKLSTHLFKINILFCFDLVCLISQGALVENSSSDPKSLPPGEVTQEWKWKRSGMLEIEMSFGEVAILAREEAKCLRDYGRRRISMDGLTFVCDPKYANYTLCVQCKDFTKKLWTNYDCGDYCGINDTLCLAKCISIIETVESESGNIDLQFENKTTCTKDLIGMQANSSNDIETQSNHESVHQELKNRNYSHPQSPKSYFPPPSSTNRNNGSNGFQQSNLTDLLQTPQVFCEGVNHPIDSSSISKEISSILEHNSSLRKVLNKTLGQNHFILLKWTVNTKESAGHKEGGTRSAILNDVKSRETQSINLSDWISLSAKNETESVPLVFVVESMSWRQPQWKVVSKTTYKLQTVDVAYASDTYKWRVTAVGPEGIVDQIETDKYITLDGYIQPGRPRNIFVIKTKANENSTNVLIGWDPPKENACFYKVVLQFYDGDGPSKQIRIKEDPLGVHHYWFDNLHFGTKYSIRITTRDPLWRYQSNLTELTFTTPTCLQSHHYRFDKCEPPAPFAISAVLDSCYKGENSKCLVTLKWQPPLNTSMSNPIQKYIVEVTSSGAQTHTPFPRIVNSTTAKINMTSWKNIPQFYDCKVNSTIKSTLMGNNTKLVLKDLQLNCEYAVMVTAYSVRGASPVAHFLLSTKYPKDEYENSTLRDWLYLAVPMSTMLLVLLGCHFIRVYIKKRQVKLARNHYFKSMEERDEMSLDWSIVPLTEEENCWKLPGESFSKDKWEIMYENLTMGEVIGQGAFGVVRRARIARKKLLGNPNYLGIESKREQENPTRQTKDDVDMETVAVKMLKVSATRDDRDQLIKEIVTMQNLGCHAQIVGLLGGCTKGRTLCLVLEYCPGGDLLTFLRKVRAKYWPTLGLSDNQATSTRESVALSHTTSSDCSQKSPDSPPINYADIGSFSDGTSWNDKCAQEYGIETEGLNVHPPSVTEKIDKLKNSNSFDSDAACRPIDEKDVLSYARQIAMGMEYLEKNRVVHRDLACRNILLLGDYKQVKISDFGLSRDVYTWNVYHQKSNGKLPIKWMAIESIFTHVFTSKSDVWSFGILLWELVTLGGTPYPGVGNTELFQLLKSGYRMERPDNSSEELYALMKKCWRTAPASRSNFSELRHHLESMMEAAEPSLYLSLMADIPSDYFHLSSRSDLLDTYLDKDECRGSKKEISGDNTRQQRWRQHSYPYNNSSTGEIRNHHPRGSYHGPHSIGKQLAFDIPRIQEGCTDETLRSETSERRLRLQSVPPKRFSLELNVNTGNMKANNSCLSADSGIQRSEISEAGLPEFCDQISFGDDNVIESECDEDDEESPKLLSETDCFPMRTFNSMTVIENKSYDLT